MNGVGTRTNGEGRHTGHLPSPEPTPEPEDVSPLNHGLDIESKKNGPLREVTNTFNAESNGNMSTSSRSRSTSINEEVILSDTSEKIRPIKRPGDGRRKSSVSEHEKILKLSPRQIQELTSEPASIPVRAATPILEDELEDRTPDEDTEGNAGRKILGVVMERLVDSSDNQDGESGTKRNTNTRGRLQEKEVVLIKTPANDFRTGRPLLTPRAVTTPSSIRRKDSSRSRPRANTQTQERDERRPVRHVPPPLSLDNKDGSTKATQHDRHQESRDHRNITSPAPNMLPLPPLSMPTFLSLELSASRPSPLYIYRPATTDFPYESSQMKYDRLLNFLKVFVRLETTLAFGALACMDAWMHVLTILPLRLLLAIGILVRWWGSVLVKEVRDIWAFIYDGLPRVWRRRKLPETPSAAQTPAEEEPPPLSRKSSATATTSARHDGNRGKLSANFRFPEVKEQKSRRTRPSRFRHRRTKSTPSTLLPSHKADLLKGLLVIASCFVLMLFDASRMYHGIRGQSAIKLYVIYNVLEVCDRLLSAVGQDVLECLFSRETLERDSDGRSKVLRPFGMFALALVYTVAHATALFYQVITLNVAVNSYSNALLTLLMSNQFVEIKGTVFKKFEKENLFQITCADVVERFQLWLMLLIIAMRNVVEVGGLSIQSSGTSWTDMLTGSGNNTTTAAFAASTIIPKSFTIFPKYIAQVLHPFLLVLGSEMFVDWLKHAYITKFNQYKPELYGKFLDVLAKDYYSNAFTDPELTRRLGLPVIPLSCLFIRAAIQTYHMFIAMHMPPPLPTMSTSLTSDPESQPATTAALAHIDHVFRRALGRSTFGAGTPSQPWYYLSSWSLDDLIAGSTMLIVFLVGYLVFLAFKLVLGMLLLSVSRKRYHGMREREMVSVETGGKRIGGFGVVDVDEDKRKAIYDDDPDSLKRLKERDEKSKKKEDLEKETGTSFGHVSRYAMVAKRIW